LQRLSLESNLISNLGLTGLSKALIDNEALEELYLYNNDIDDESIESFLGMLKNKTKLRILGMEYNKIRNKCDGIFRTVT
jgi:Leucine-rich repeat (LRR) protein